MTEGKLFWSQLSMWEFSPDNCIEAYTKCDQHLFHYVLLQSYDVVNNRYKTRPVTDHNSIPLELLLKDKSSVYIKINGKREILNEGNK